MKIRRIILKGVHNFTDFERSFEDSWTGTVPDSLLLIGPNGTGKTTLLNVIAGLWQILYDFLEGDKGPWYQSANFASGSAVPNQSSGSGVKSGDKNKTLDRLLFNSKLAAMQVEGFLDTPNFWLFAGDDSDTCKQFIRENRDELRIGRYYEQDKDTDFIREVDGFYEPGSIQGVATDDMEKYPDWYFQWRQNLIQNVYGGQHNLPNLVYLESETRLLQPIRTSEGMTREPEEFQWLARYEPSTSRKGSLQNYLFAQKAVNPSLFQDIIKQVNTFFSGKRLVDFSPKSYQLMVEVGNQKHSVDELSSGEKQILMMLVTIIRHLEPGGIVMIDEPDLHLHVSLVNAFVSHLRKMVSEKNGQLILASHAPELWRMFNEAEKIQLGKIFDQGVVE